VCALLLGCTILGVAGIPALPDLATHPKIGPISHNKNHTSKVVYMENCQKATFGKYFDL
jgi:hypothetical protein